jgi:hypothetical protein
MQFDLRQAVDQAVQVEIGLLVGIGQQALNTSIAPWRALSASLSSHARMWTLQVPAGATAGGNAG